VRESKTKIKLLRPEDVWHPHRGGRPGNTNALKTGLHTAEVKDLRRRLRAWRRRANALIEEVEARLEAAKPAPTNPSHKGRGAPYKTTGPHHGGPDAL
jgi:hypothetical protein